MSLVGIYSFPKSGNTWVRAILAAIMNESNQKIPDLHKDELSAAGTFNGFQFFKHHAGRNLKRWGGQTLKTEQVIHIRRHPLDVFVSYLNFISDNVTGSAPVRFKSVDAIHGTDLFDMYFHSFVIYGHVSVGFLNVTKTYFDHNNYWLTQTEVPAIHLRYEDLLADAPAALTPVRDLLGIDDSVLLAALETASATTRKNGKFFWKQQSNTYLEYLSPAQIDLFKTYRGEDSRAIGYDLDAPT